MPHHGVVFDDAVENAGVDVWRQLPLERQLEISELVDGYDVASLPDASENAINGLPSGSQRRLPVPAPARRRLAIEQQPPAVGSFFRGQCIGSRLRHVRSLV